MADNYIEKQFEQYEVRKAAWEKEHKLGNKKRKCKIPFHNKPRYPTPISQLQINEMQKVDKNEGILHYFKTTITHIPLPDKFTYPFQYTPHPLCLLAAKEVQHYLKQQVQWKEELDRGKMFGVLIVQTPEGEIGYLCAFSGILDGSNKHPFFVPPVYDLLKPEGFFKIEEEHISQINLHIWQLEEDNAFMEMKETLYRLEQTKVQELEDMKLRMKKAKEKRDERRSEALLHPDNALSPEEENTLIRESQYQKAEYKRLERAWQARLAVVQERLSLYEKEITALKTERKIRSAALQQRLFFQFNLLNYLGENKNLCDIFKETVHKTPPAGAGECAAPKLLQAAYLHHCKPIAMAEFWWGASPKTEIRHHGLFYPACQGKCGPILRHMLQGLDVEDNPIHKNNSFSINDIKILYEDPWLWIINKPPGMLSVPGKGDRESVYSLIREQFPNADGPLTVHRLDMATSGLMMIAKNKLMHQKLQELFRDRLVHKHYVALLEGIVSTDQGTINLPLRPNPLDRPRQMIDTEYGKSALTDFEVLERKGNRTRIVFMPRTGRTHQLRIHAAHPLGLHCPIVGDELYGKKAERLYLHAETLEFIHPITHKLIKITQKADF